jgi:hypothetical protein
MTKLVNLDELAAPARSLQFKGQTHEVIDLSVENFIAFQNDFDALLKSQEVGDNKVLLETATAIIDRCVPTFVGKVPELNLRQVMAAVQLIADFYPATEDAPSGNE